MHLAWSQALAMLPPLEQPELEIIANSLPHPAAARHLGQYLSREPDPQEALRRFLQEVDESEEGLKDWLAAFAHFARHVEQTHHRPNLTDAMGYLHCCEAVTHTGARYESLPMSVESMLSIHGYEGPEVSANPS